MLNIFIFFARQETRSKNTRQEIHVWLFLVYPQRLDPGAVQRALLTEKVVVKEVDVEMEVVVIQ